MGEKPMEMLGRLVLSVMVCGLGGLQLWLTAGQVGMFWVAIALGVIWIR